MLPISRLSPCFPLPKLDHCRQRVHVVNLAPIEPPPPRSQPEAAMAVIFCHPNAGSQNKERLVLITAIGGHEEAESHLQVSSLGTSAMNRRPRSHAAAMPGL